jgi:hypothetical protein
VRGTAEGDSGSLEATQTKPKEQKMRAGSLQNYLYDGAACKTPEVGDGATMLSWTDRHPGTVVAVSPGHRVVVQRDHYERTDPNGMSDAQSYRFWRNPSGQKTVYSRRKDGSYREVGGQRRVLFGGRDAYHDYSF